MRRRPCITCPWTPLLVSLSIPSSAGSQLLCFVSLIFFLWAVPGVVCWMAASGAALANSPLMSNTCAMTLLHTTITAAYYFGFPHAYRRLLRLATLLWAYVWRLSYLFSFTSPPLPLTRFPCWLYSRTLTMRWRCGVRPAVLPIVSPPLQRVSAVRSGQLGLPLSIPPSPFPHLIRFVAVALRQVVFIPHRTCTTSKLYSRRSCFTCACFGCFPQWTYSAPLPLSPKRSLLARGVASHFGVGSCRPHRHWCSSLAPFLCFIGAHSMRISRFTYAMPVDGQRRSDG